MQEKEVVMPIYDEKRGELLGTGGEDYVMISAEALRKINKQEQLMLGSGSFVIWYNSGRAVGQEDGKRFAPLMDTMEIDKFAGYLRDTYSRYGWGQIEYGDVDLKSGELLFRVTNSPLVRGVTAKEPRCWFVRGFAEGLISEILRTEVVAVETECMAAGASHCDFRIRWTESGQK